MNLFNFVRIIFLLLAIISFTFIVPILVAIFYKEFAIIKSFAIPGIICIAIAIILFFIRKKEKLILTPKDSFIIVACSWLFASILGAIPFLISKTIPNITDAFFESVSGFTTTGATILSDVESLPISINLWRCQMHWLGGMGIVALTVALLPLLGVGGFQLIKAETTGPEKGKVTPKITTTAKILWFIYVGFTLLQTVLLRLAGMSWIESLAHAFSTLGTGGFSTRNSSIASFNSNTIEWICTIFMFLAGINFSLYFYLFTKKMEDIRKNSELKAYFLIVLLAIIIIAFFISPEYSSLADVIRVAAFQVTSILSTTGLASVNYMLWPAGALLIIFILMFIGGSSGSTAGGVKVIRWVVLAKQMSNEVKRLLHPHGVFNIRLNGRAGRKDVVFSVAGFMFLYFLLVIITAIVVSFEDIDVISSFTASLAMIGNIGPGFGAVGPVENFGFFSDFIKWWLSFVMIAGRLEFYTIIVFFMPSFWKK